jgi:hypothetical protein
MFCFGKMFPFKVHGFRTQKLLTIFLYKEHEASFKLCSLLSMWQVILLKLKCGCWAHVFYESLFCSGSIYPLKLQELQVVQNVRPTLTTNMVPNREHAGDIFLVILMLSEAVPVDEWKHKAQRSFKPTHSDSDTKWTCVVR